MKVAFLLQSVEEARIIRGYFEDKGHKIAIYSSPEDILNLEFIPDVTVTDTRCIDTDDKLRLVLSSSEKILLILPFWEDAVKIIRDTREKANFWKLKGIRIKAIKRPFTVEELLNFIKEIFKIEKA